MVNREEKEEHRPTLTLWLTLEHPGFRIAEEDANCSGEGAEYTLSLSGGHDASLPIGFRP